MNVSAKTTAKFLTAVKKHKTFLLTAHVNPDPDAICSELAMARLLKKLGRKAVIVNDDPLPDRFKFLPGAAAIKHFNRSGKIQFDAVIILDSGDVKRIGRVARMLTPGKTLINIDHHVTSHFFGDLNIVEPEVSSTAEMIFGLYKFSGVALDKTVAELLYAGIMTDTGSFRYDNTSAHTHQVAAELLTFGISPAFLYKQVYETVPRLDFQYFTRIVSRFEFLAGGKIICLSLPQRIFSRFSAEFDLRDKIFRELRTIRGVEVVFILTEAGRKATKVNLRSHGHVDVSRIAALFGGGGHRKASGCQLSCSMRQAKQKIYREVLKSI